MSIKEEYKEIIRAAKAGGEVVRKYFGKTLALEGKSTPADFRTKADLGSEKAVLDILQKKFPKYNILSEEVGEINKNSEYTFVIDPLDGTNNFSLGIPNFTTGIGLMKGGETIFGVVYAPVLKSVYFAEKGKGAYSNNKKIHVNNESELKKSTVSYVGSYACPYSHTPEVVAKFYNNGAKRLLSSWSVLFDMCLIASGKIEAAIVCGPEIYDFIPAKLIAKEAGALVTDLDGEKAVKDKDVTFLVSNGSKIHQEILKILKS
jgi:myo-inositol-1(or 4)-monophosphatase